MYNYENEITLKLAVEEEDINSLLEKVADIIGGTVDSFDHSVEDIEDGFATIYVWLFDDIYDRAETKAVVRKILHLAEVEDYDYELPFYL